MSDDNVIALDAIREALGRTDETSALVRRATARLAAHDRWFAVVMKRVAEVCAASKESDLALRMAVATLLLTLEERP